VPCWDTIPGANGYVETKGGLQKGVSMKQTLCSAGDIQGRGGSSGAQLVMPDLRHVQMVKDMSTGPCRRLPLTIHLVDSLLHVFRANQDYMKQHSEGVRTCIRVKGGPANKLGKARTGMFRKFLPFVGGSPMTMSSSTTSSM